MRVGIVGMGLIGGSLGLALRGLAEDVEVLGVTRDQSAATAAVKRGAAQRATAELSDLSTCDLVVVATPIHLIAAVFEQLSTVVRRGGIVTDVASVKRPVVTWGQRLREPERFLGGHPVAGKVQGGLSSSDASLFRGAPWVFTPLEGQDLEPFEAWFELVRAIGAVPRFMAAAEHDRQMAFLSHLAFTLSSAYAETVRPQAESALGGPGFRGMVRLAQGDDRLYQDIASANRGPLLDAIDRFTAVLNDYRDRIDRGDHVGELFSEAAHVTR